MCHNDSGFLSNVLRVQYVTEARASFQSEKVNYSQSLSKNWSHERTGTKATHIRDAIAMTLLWADLFAAL